MEHLQSIWLYLRTDNSSWQDALHKTWNCWHTQNFVVILLMAILCVIAIRLARRKYWRNAFHRAFRKRSVGVCFVILCLYAGVGLLDSAGYHPYLRDDDKAIRRNPDSGIPLINSKGLSLLDVMLTPLREKQEQTYSAPLATHLLTKQIVVSEEGKIKRKKPALKYPRSHLLGTDKVGMDVLYVSLKSIRTGLIIGLFTTLIVIPFAMFAGILAGYLGGWIDDIIQFIYTVLSSIPSILLIAAFMTLFKKAGLPQLCFILGIVSWTGLCRVLRGETMKVREMEFVQASRAAGVSRARIMMSHIAPNVMHLALISAILGFSGRVLSEAVLTYLGIGVGPDTFSWGSMINLSLGELSRDPVIWWNLISAFVFMLGLVLPANLFGDAMRDALDPRLKTE